LDYLIRHLGRASFFLLLITAASGILLAFHYQPSSPYQSVMTITHHVRFGCLMRGTHCWAANVLIFLIAAHLFRGLLEGKYKEFRSRWAVGALMGLIVLGSAFTGYLLIWDQGAYWATIIGTNIIDSLPFIGGALKRFLLGGIEYSRTTIHRFYVLHTLILPASLVVLLLWHIRRLDQVWTSSSCFFKRLACIGEKRGADSEAWDTETTGYLLLELMEALCLLGLIMLLAAWVPPEIDKKANPLATPVQIKPDWYFLFIYQGLKYVPKEVGSVLFLWILPAAIITLPLWDKSRHGKIRPVQRPVATALVSLVFLVVLVLTVLGWLA
jgi:quinol-cytochrome oxidoreductase complex cytochrome b subunit